MTTNVEKEFKNFLSYYASYDKQNNCYTGTVKKENLSKLGDDYAKLINKLLLIDGASQASIESNFRSLTLLLHPDRKELYIPEISWLESNLSEGHHDGTCFKILGSCKDKLMNPENFKKINFSQIKTRAELKKWLEDLKVDATTYTRLSLIDTLIGLVDETGGFYDDISAIKSKNFRLFISMLPLYLSSYGVLIFADELLAIYGLSFIFLKGGQYLERTESETLQQLGKTLQNISAITATTTTNVLIGILEITFWTSRLAYQTSLELGTAILSPLLTGPIEKPHVDMEEAELSKSTTLVNPETTSNTQYRSPEFNQFCAPLMAYCKTNSQQFFRFWRSGEIKFEQIDLFLRSMQLLDLYPLPLELKLIAAQNQLDRLKSNKAVYGVGVEAPRAIDEADKLINELKETSSTNQLVVGSVSNSYC